jgi:hypothetical protein
MGLKVKELKDDALVSIEVNKSYYFMAKQTLFYLFETADIPQTERENTLKNLMTKDYGSMSKWERSFYTVTLLIAEIEKQAKENDLFEEKEIDSEPTQD